ncbi:MAG: L-histidine N(alpha)-methyltransferase [Rhodomicrobium sp.]
MLVGFEAAASFAEDDFLEQVLQGLSLRQKELPSRFFYDSRGSELFEQITALPEYYLTRVEVRLLQSRATVIRKSVPSGVDVVEFGSGSSRKTELLLGALDRPCSYIPIEISASALYPAAERIQQKFPGLRVFPILGGFHDLDKIKLPATGHPCLGFFPGSTIGNLTPHQAVPLLRAAKRLLGPGALFLIGADLQKPLDILLPAYNDSKGVTAAFNLNILTRINRELGANFDLGQFQHEAIYNGQENRVEMHLRSLTRQRVSIASRSFAFKAGETIHTENSYKYTIAGLQGLAKEAGWTPSKSWTEDDGLFSLHLLA